MRRYRLNVMVSLWYLTLVVLHNDMRLSLQVGQTALINASKAGQVECVKVLLDRGAEVNMQDNVSGVIIHCAHAMKHVPRVLSSE